MKHYQPMINTQKDQCLMAISQEKSKLITATFIRGTQDHLQKMVIILKIMLVDNKLMAKLEVKQMYMVFKLRGKHKSMDIKLRRKHKSIVLKLKHKPMAIMLRVGD